MTETDPFEEEGIIEALSILANSSNVTFQMSAVAGFCEALYREDVDIKKINFKMLKPILQLLKSNSVVVQENALVVLCRLAENNQNKEIIARSGSLVPLLHLSQSKDVGVQEAATVALTELALLQKNIQPLVDAGTVPVVAKLLRASSLKVQLHSVVIINCIAHDQPNLEKLALTEVGLVDSLIALSDSAHIRARREAAMALGTLAREEYFRSKIVKGGGLKSLHKLLLSTDPLTILGSLICINQISDQPQHQSRLIDGGVLDRLKELLAYDEKEDIRSRAAFTLSRLAFHGELGRVALVEAGVVERSRTLAQSASPCTQALLAFMMH
ncbi:Vacuolar protein 8 [Mortierella sp. AD094]|nr:Vacuolar protein 8 [Mortierella sp. AD094]